VSSQKLFPKTINLKVMTVPWVMTKCQFLLSTHLRTVKDYYLSYSHLVTILSVNLIAI